jgi:hypothetical protein
MDRKSAATIIILLMGFIPLPTVLAAGRGWYVGAGLGQSLARADNLEADLAAAVERDQSFGTASYYFDDTDTGWRLYGGYSMDKHFAIEFGYVDLGNIETAFSSTITDLRGEVSKSQTEVFSTDAFALSAVGLLPTQGKLSLLAKAGLFRWRFNEQDTRTCTDQNPTINRCESFLSQAGEGTEYGYSFIYGLGFLYQLDQKMALRGEWENYSRIGGNRLDQEIDINVFSAALEYRFEGVPVYSPGEFYLDSGRLFYGTGIGLNSVSSTDNGSGVQVFAGYDPMYHIKRLKFDFEIGYMTTGDMKFKHPVGNRLATRANGLWLAAVGHLALFERLELLARLGGDFGDDAGILAGTGLGYTIGQVGLRLEYVVRENIDSIQFNIVYRP